jgi:ribosomal protein S18 acetylase RimI-like enzyme
VISLRDATADDAEQVARIYVDSWNAGFAGHLPPRELSQREVARWREDLADAPVRWRVAVDSGGVVGFAGTGPCRDPVDPRLGELDTIAVSPDCWRRGVGRALMDDALDALRAAPFGAAVLWTLADYARGDAFYRSAGWRPDGRSRDSGRQISYRHPLTRSETPRPSNAPAASVAPMDATDERVLANFLGANGRLTTIPSKLSKLLVVLDHLAQEFEPGQTYPEAQVNTMLQRFHPDYAALRRYLVENGFLTREDNVYWRSGGTFEV